MVIMKMLLRLCPLLLSALLPLGEVALAVPSSVPTGVTFYDPAKAHNSFVLFDGSDQRTHLIDMNGNEVKRWNYPGFPSVPLSPSLAGGMRGHLLLQLANLRAPDMLASSGNGLFNEQVGEVDWDGHVLWSWGSTHAPAYQHHDLRRLAGGDTLMLTSELTPLAGYKAPRVIDNIIRQIDREGREVWRWRVSDHLEELGFTDEQLRLIRESDDPDFLHLNTMAPLGSNRWYAQGDQRFASENVMVSARNANLVFIVDRQTGKVVWRLGPNYEKVRLAGPVPRPVDQIIGQHDTHLIPEGLPGAGNLLVFDNQGSAGFPPARKGIFSASRVIEIDPQTRQIVWQYTAIQSGRAPWTFFSAFISNARRLPNGNTLINEGQHGRLFQVTAKGEIAWEYVSPYSGKSTPTDRYVTNRIYRAEAVNYDWAPSGTPFHEQPVKSDCARYSMAPGCVESEAQQGGQDKTH
jgi:hypothetical protein